MGPRTGKLTLDPFACKAMMRPTSQITNHTICQTTKRIPRETVRSVRIHKMIQTTRAAPCMTVADAALYLTSASSLPTNRKMMLPMGGNKAQARMVYRFLLLPTALGVPPIGAGCPGGGGGICDIGVLLEMWRGSGPIMSCIPTKHHRLGCLIPDRYLRSIHSARLRAKWP